MAMGWPGEAVVTPDYTGFRDGCYDCRGRTALFWSFSP